MSSKPDYGIDSPPIVTGLFLLSGISFGATTVLHLFGNPFPVAEIASLVFGIYFLVAALGIVR